MVHHLFPGICHTHYPAIAPIVMDTCKEFNVPYKIYPTVSLYLLPKMPGILEAGQKRSTATDQLPLIMHIVVLCASNLPRL